MLHPRYILVLALVLGVVPRHLQAQARTPAVACGSAPFVLRNVRLFDGEKVTDRVDVYVRDTLITKVGAMLTVPAGTRSCSGRGFTLLPGLFDGHAHVNERMNLEEALRFGVTTELDMFAQLDTINALRASGLLNSGNVLADFRSAGTLVTTAGGHGTEFGFSIPTLQSPDSAQQFIDHRLAEGSDYIKIVYDNGTEWGFSGPMLDSATMFAAIKAAKMRGVLAIVHIGSYRGAVTALQAGADGIAHIFGDSLPDGDYGKLVAEHNAFVMTTLTPLGQLSADPTWGMDPMLHNPAVAKRIDPGQDSSMDNRFSPSVKAHMNVARRVARQLRAANVPVIAGSDAPAPGTAHGITLHIELRNMVRAGFTPLEALRSATSIPARIFSLTDRGRVAPGLRSDLLLVHGDPTVDINSTLRIARVWKRGRMVNRSVSSTGAPTARQTALEAANVLGGFDRSRPAMGTRVARLKDSEWHAFADAASEKGTPSTADLTITPSGAMGSTHALRVQGQLNAAAPGAYAGVVFRPLRKVIAPRAFYGFSGLEFWTRGDHRTYLIALELENGTVTPAREFHVDRAWKKKRFFFEDFGVSAAGSITGVRFYSADHRAPGFTFDLDQARLW